VAGLVWRLTFGWLVVGALRLTVRLARRYGPRLAVGAAALGLWPSVAVAWGLRRHALPAAAARWPGGTRWYGPGLGLAGGLLVAAYALSGDSWRPLLARLYGAGWLAPLAVPLGVSPLLAGRALAVGVPLWLAGGVVLAGLWPLYAPLVRRVLRTPAVGAGWGEGPGDRRSVFGPHQEAPIAVTLRPVPTQRVATTRFAEEPWTVKPLFGPGLLAMVVAPPGLGKSELYYGALAAAHDGLPFCGLETSRPRRVLLLTEMTDRLLKNAMLRWGFVAEPAGGGLAGAVGRLRLRFTRPPGSAGHFIDVCYAHDLYAPQEDGRRPQWVDVVRGVVPVVERGGYDLVMVDSLARWMGNDSSNAAMLDALGALRQVTRLGVGVLAPHHCAKDAQAPYEPRGGSAILGELDLCWSLARLPGCTDPLHDPRRVLACVKSRDAESTPPPLRLERLDWDPAAPRPRYGYRLLDAVGSSRAGTVETSPLAWQESPRGAQEGAALTDNQRAVLDAMRSAPGHLATTPELATATGLEPNRAKECAVALIRQGYARVAGEGPAPARGGRRPTRYVCTPLGLGLGAPGSAARPPLRLVPAGLPPPSGGGRGEGAA
jgi:AAA domain